MLLVTTNKIHEKKFRKSKNARVISHCSYVQTKENAEQKRVKHSTGVENVP